MLVGAGITLLASGAATGKGSRATAGRPTGGGASASLTLHTASALTLALSPDHRTISMNLLGNLWTLPASGGTATRTSSLMQDTAYPDWSPDGKTIAFQSYKSGTFHIWAMNPDGTNVRELTSGFYDDREPQFSPDGTKIAFSSDRPPAGSPAGIATGSYNIWTLTLATGQLTEITHQSGGANDYYPTWTPDGKQITYVDTSHAIESTPSDGTGSATTLYTDATNTFYSPTWSPDGKSLAYTELVNQGTLTQLFVNGKALSGNEDVFAFPARWASNDSLIYAADGKILQRSVSAGTVQTIPFSAKVSFNRASYPMKAHDFDSTAKQPATGVLSPELSPDGRHVAFVALNQLYEMAIGHKPVALTNTPWAKATPVWSPDGRYLAYASDEDGPMAIYIRNIDTGATRRLTAPFTGAQAKLAWSPNGQKIAFETALDSEAGSQALYVADVASGQFHEVFGPDNAKGADYEIAFEPGAPSWGPDSNTIALAVQQSYSTRFREGRADPHGQRHHGGHASIHPLSLRDDHQSGGRRRPGVVAGRQVHGLRARRRPVGPARDAGGRARRPSPAAHQRGGRPAQLVRRLTAHPLRLRGHAPAGVGRRRRARDRAGAPQLAPAGRRRPVRRSFMPARSGRERAAPSSTTSTSSWWATTSSASGRPSPARPTPPASSTSTRRMTP